MIRKYHNYTMQTDPRHREEELVRFLILSILVTPKSVVWLAVKTHMKCHILRRKYRLSEKEIQHCLEKVTCDTSIYDLVHHKFIYQTSGKNPLMHKSLNGCHIVAKDGMNRILRF